ncbi:MULTISPECIES: BlaI/MecI/CopY family transcriptional regulator [Paenibacillus]|uniref:Beta-lactamase repressor n=1 Tax=Paenibacillus azoreducens TaxID=116718 RepID=A0A919YIQ9_9BACL|nr:MULTISPECIES: BlaI/MecI/CopY family transcriptional regulator [Paenibacillus]MBE9917491.1 BlaI/MecI/CopY family transcriptional regulator [Paenibacillus donghaensis]GIO51499.1 beta-lactamase repressor [Paenibacillus azoreducens]
MDKMPKISESEWEIMKVVWREHPLTAEQIVQHLPQGTDWSDQTVRTFINRLMKKKALGYQKSGRSYLYYPLISEKECVRAESRSFLNRVFNGAAGLMMTNFLEETQLSDQEIERLQQILLEKQKKDSKDSSRS